MDPIYTNGNLPKEFLDRFQLNHDTQIFRCRAVLVRVDNHWELECCVVESFLLGTEPDERLSTRKYSQVILYESYLTSAECWKLATETQGKKVKFGDIVVPRSTNNHCCHQMVPVNNDYMIRAGSVFNLSFGCSHQRSFNSILLASDQPYYPTVEEATRDWLPFSEYHGSSDARNGEIHFLFPESRAFISRSVFLEDSKLLVEIDGDEVGSRIFRIKGAYWEEKLIHHIDGLIQASKIELNIPSDYDRLEYYLIDENGAVYDFHREDRFSRFKAPSNSLGSLERALIDQMRKAIRDGEGQHVEFKPFVDPAQRHINERQKTKLGEIVCTAVAFANSKGGNIYLGIDDDCSPTGIDKDLCKWADAAADASIQRYLGELKSRIKGLVDGELVLNVNHARIDNGLIVIIEVPPAVEKPVAMQQDKHLYARIGASNKKIPPDHWKSVIVPTKVLG
ncbi:helix-turn-helix domain-containing protein [Undibacterium sp. Ji83W]|uniref:AlbA family DNA-binding domain-containing protein n=1 Tax=Undibacterium sp. Ji83W TaxID=3413043 RepID=UPI003BF367F6